MEKTTFVQKCIIYDAKNKKILLLKRGQTQNSPDKWDFVGGVCEFDEDANDSMLRKAREEAGLILKNNKVIDVYSHIFSSNERVVLALYSCNDYLYFNKELVLSDEHDDHVWIHPDNINNYELMATLEIIKPRIIEFLKTYD